jgi:hypothetical protein
MREDYELAAQIKSKIDVLQQMLTQVAVLSAEKEYAV